MSHLDENGSCNSLARNSAITCVVPVLPTNVHAETDPTASQISGIGDINQLERLMPAGLKALCDTYSNLYRDQPNPLQVTTKLKYWLGGQDPLDYISMYWNPGIPDQNVPPHWHYTSFGLSDLHGDGRVHPPPDRVLVASPSPPPSGHGLELTFRLAAEPGIPPPLWPAALLQALARYIFTTGNKLYSGDHISWHAALDGDRRSRIRHLLVATEPQLSAVRTSHGTVAFLQLVGCTERELRASQRGSGAEVLKLISEDPKCGGSWLVTVSSRRTSARRVRVRRTNSCAELAGVSARVRWQPYTTESEESEGASEDGCLPVRIQQQIKDTLQRGLETMVSDRTEGDMSTDSFQMSSIERALPDIPDLMQGSWQNEGSIEYLDGVHLILNAEGASLLPLAIDGRVMFGRHFTWRDCGRAVTVLAQDVSGAFVTVNQPYATRRSWLQVVIPKELAVEMSSQVSRWSTLGDNDSEPEEEEEDGSDNESERDGAPPAIPLTLTWPEYKLKISILPDQCFL